MKVLTITCHRPHNYGAVLQTYALNKYLRDLGHDARVIDYIPAFMGRISEKHKNNPIIKIIRKIVIFPDNIKGGSVFGGFLKKYVKLTEKTYTRSKLIKDTPRADIYITGSDQVWNSEIPAGRDDTYFLDFVKPPAGKVSYAASMASDKLDEKQKKRYKELLSDFRAISVREASSVKILEEIGIKAQSTADPVFLLPRCEWSGFAEKTDIKEKYVLVYAFNGQKNVFEFADRLAKEKKLKVYSVHTRWLEGFRNTDKYYWCPSPNEFLCLIKNAEYVVTNSFHGICFSIIFNKEFFAFKKGESGNSRIIDLLDYFGLKDRLITKENNSVSGAINYRHIETKIKDLSDEAKLYIKNVLTEVEEWKD